MVGIFWCDTWYALPSDFRINLECLYEPKSEYRKTILFVDNKCIKITYNDIEVATNVPYYK